MGSVVAFCSCDSTLNLGQEQMKVDLEKLRWETWGPSGEQPNTAERWIVSKCWSSLQELHRAK